MNKNGIKMWRSPTEICRYRTAQKDDKHHSLCNEEVHNYEKTLNCDTWEHQDCI